jgi:hypothetical protein
MALVSPATVWRVIWLSRVRRATRAAATPRLTAA